ncbi:MAG: hypothetical protein JWN78_2540 [Bacteroidota bacterium]|nr:hypothetical protein [Bacteroidota bacterium]
MIISPSVDPFPKIEAARNELTIRFKHELQPNTTYSIFFGDNIKDNNEGNAYPDFKYIFSTGSFIDSLRIRGTVKTALDKIPDNSYLLLYTEKEDSAFTRKKPYYISKISSDGKFSLENIKEGDYRVYALSDKNSNFYYDLPTEAIGFTDSVFHIKSNLDTLSLSIFIPEEDKLRVYDFDRVINGGILHFTFNKELSLTNDQITVTVSGQKEIAPVAFPIEELLSPTERNGKMIVYFPKMPMDTSSLTLIIKNKDQLIDSLQVRMESRKFPKPVFYFNDSIAYRSLNAVENIPLKLISSYYSLSPIDTSRIFITDTSSSKIPYTVSRAEDMRTYLFSIKNMKPGMKYKLQLLDSALFDLVGNLSKKQEISFLGMSAKKMGNLLITYELPQKSMNYIIFLKDNSGKVSDKRIVRDSQAVKINYGLQVPGSYSVEIVEDRNGNGIWNSGSFFNKTLPERIYKEAKPILVKENWDAEEIIHADFNKTQTPINNNDINKSPTDKSDKKKLLDQNFDRKK